MQFRIRFSQRLSTTPSRHQRNCPSHSPGVHQRRCTAVLLLMLRCRVQHIVVNVQQQQQKAGHQRCLDEMRPNPERHRSIHTQPICSAVRWIMLNVWVCMCFCVLCYCCSVLLSAQHRRTEWDRPAHFTSPSDHLASTFVDIVWTSVGCLTSANCKWQIHSLLLTLLCRKVYYAAATSVDG